MSGYQESYQLNKQRNEEIFKELGSSDDSNVLWKSKNFHENSTKKSQMNFKNNQIDSC